MARPIILASSSDIRAQLLRNAGIRFEVEKPRLDEEAIKAALLAEDVGPRDLADALAEGKAVKVSGKRPGALVLGCDQVLEHEGEVLSKPESPEAARDQIGRLRGGRHRLLSAAVIAENGKPIWRHVGVVRLQMRQVSDAYLDDYITRNWDSIRWAVGSYKLEEEGVRLFSRIEGDYFNVLGLPLLELIAYLVETGDIDA